MTEDPPLAGKLRWPAVGLLAAFLIAGAFTRDPRDLGLSATGCVVAITAASMLAARGARTAVALAALAGAGVALDAGGHGQCLAWFDQFYPSNARCLMAAVPLALAMPSPLCPPPPVKPAPNVAIL